MRQRAMIAMALACEPKLLIADEPTTALDVTIQKQILELIDGLRQRLGMAVILVTHDLGVIAGRADKVCVMYAGQIVETTDTDDACSPTRATPTPKRCSTRCPRRGADRGQRLYSHPGHAAGPDPALTACRFAPRCRYAQDKCRARATRSWPAGRGLHRFACFFPVGVEEKPARRPGGPGGRGHRGRGRAAAGDQHRRADPEDQRPGQGLPDHHGCLLRRKIGTVSAVADVSVGIRAGETFGLVGESGCGKTTIGRLIVGLEKATSGIHPVPRARS